MKLQTDQFTEFKDNFGCNFGKIIFLKGGVESGGKDNTKQTNELLLRAL